MVSMKLLKLFVLLASIFVILFSTSNFLHSANMNDTSSSTCATHCIVDVKSLPTETIANYGFDGLVNFTTFLAFSILTFLLLGGVLRNSIRPSPNLIKLYLRYLN